MSNIILNITNYYSTNDLRVNLCGISQPLVDSYVFQSNNDCLMTIQDDDTNNIALLSYIGSSNSLTQNYLCPMASISVDPNNPNTYTLTLGNSFTFALEVSNLSNESISITTYSEIVFSKNPNITNVTIDGKTTSSYSMIMPQAFGTAPGINLSTNTTPSCYLYTDPILGVTLPQDGTCSGFSLMRNANSPTDFALSFGNETIPCQANGVNYQCLDIGECKYQGGINGCFYEPLNVFCSADEMLDTINKTCCKTSSLCSVFCCSSDQSCMEGSDQKGSLCCPQDKVCGSACCLNGTTCDSSETCS